jgi:hypothetical protein
VRVTVTCKKTTDEWSQDNEMEAEFTARKTNGQYQTVHLSQEEADATAEVIVACISSSGRMKLLRHLLKGLSNAKLLRALAYDLRDRVRLPKER